VLKLGIEAAQSTVAKYMAKSGRGRPQTWKTFLHNHAAGSGVGQGAGTGDLVSGRAGNGLLTARLPQL
jgi:lipid-binding SYLF domain-containing protein